MSKANINGVNIEHWQENQQELASLRGNKLPEDTVLVFGGRVRMGKSEMHKIGIALVEARKNHSKLKKPFNL